MAEITDRERLERMLAPLYKAQQSPTFGDRELQQLFRDNRGTRLALDILLRRTR